MLRSGPPQEYQAPIATAIADAQQPSLKYKQNKQILSNRDIAWTRLDRDWRKSVEPTHVESTIKVSCHIRRARQAIRCRVVAFSESGTLPIKIIASDASRISPIGDEHEDNQENRSNG
jgi:hypothetical protein